MVCQKHVTLQKIVAHDFQYDPRIYQVDVQMQNFILYFLGNKLPENGSVISDSFLENV